MSVIRTPQIARFYLIAAALLLALPSAMSLYTGHTGKFIVSTPRMETDPNFKETVIYIFHHSGWGAQGLVINRPLSPEKAKAMLRDMPEGVGLYVGGPVAVFDKFIIEEKPEHYTVHKKQALSITPLEIFQEENSERWEAIMSGEDANNYRIYAGYAGWGIFQLEREMIRGVWSVLHYDRELMYEMPPELVWTESIDRILGKAGSNGGGA